MRRKTHCINGHRFTEANTRMNRHRDGNLYRQCRICISDQQRRRYKNDEDFRERMKANARRRYYRQKEFKNAQRNNCNPGGDHGGVLVVGGTAVVVQP